MKTLDFLARFLFSIRGYWFLAATLFALVVKGGVWFPYNLESARLVSLDPFENPFSDPTEHIWMYNWLGPFVAWFFDFNDTRGIFLFYLTCAVLALILIATRIRFLYVERDQRRTAWLLLLTLPVLGSIFYWVGYDSLTFLLLSVTVIYLHKPLVSSAAGFLLGLQHFEQAFLAFSLLLSAFILEALLGFKTKSKIILAFLPLISTLSGKALLELIFEVNDLQLNSGRAFVLLRDFDAFVDKAILHWPFIIWATLGVSWLIAVRYLDLGRKAIPFSLPLALAVVSVFLYFDETRVFGMLTLPLILHYWILNPNFISLWSRRATATVFGVWAIVPFTWSFGGRPQISAFPFDIIYALSKFFSAITVPDNLAIWILAG